MPARKSLAAPELEYGASAAAPGPSFPDQESSRDINSRCVRIGDAPFHSSNANNVSPKKSHTGLKSEHGHSMSYVRPMTQHPGSSVATFFSGLFTTMIGISSLGTSVTFSYVLSNNASSPRSPNPVFNDAQIQLFLAISWLLFLLGLASAALGSTILNFFKEHWITDWDGLNGKTSQFQVQMYAAFAAALMGTLVIGAFVLLGLVVVAYSAIVGWIALGFTMFYGLVIGVGVLYQFPWPCRCNTPLPGLRHSDSEANLRNKSRTL